jgi:hypothetical protein
LDETYECLATLCINLCRVVDPDVIIIGGGMAQAGGLFLSSVRDVFMRRSWAIMQDSVVLVLGSDSTQSGIMGAAMAARSQLQTQQHTQLRRINSSHSLSNLALSNIGINPSQAAAVSSLSTSPADDVDTARSNNSSSSSSRSAPHSWSSSGLLALSVGLNLAVACTLLAGSQLFKMEDCKDSKESKESKGLWRGGMLRLTQGSLLVCSQIGMGIWLYSNNQRSS